MRWLMIPVLLGCLKLVGCGKDEPEAAPKTACTPRKTVFCRCPGTGEGGWQTCSADGSGFDSCVPCDGSNLDTNPQGGGSNPSFDQAECGNDKIEVGEQCDDGNLDDDDECLSDCRKAKCGDGFVRLSGSNPEECDDGNEDDTDGCTSDCKLKSPPSEKCPGDPIEVTADPAGKKISGNFKSLKPNHEGTCGGTGNDAVFSFKPPGDGEVSVSLSVPKDTSDDVVLYLREDGCEDSAKELPGGCTNAGTKGNEGLYNLPVAAGKTYYVFVDSQGSAVENFSLNVRFRPDEACAGQGGPCEVQGAAAKGKCATGVLTCSADKKELTCVPGQPSKETCGDGVDEDCDGIVDNGCPCAHDLCTLGAALAPDCKDDKGAENACIKQICEKDDFCCGKEWDDACVGEVLSICNIGACLKGDCAHPLCQAGGPLTPGCDGPADCVKNVCKTDGFCCGKEWDSNCASKIETVCSIKCSASP